MGNFGGGAGLVIHAYNTKESDLGFAVVYVYLWKCDCFCDCVMFDQKNPFVFIYLFIIKLYVLLQHTLL